MSITSKPDPTVVSLFAGCGGSSLGYKQAGYDVRLAVEWDTGAADVQSIDTNLYNHARDWKPSTGIVGTLRASQNPRISYSDSWKRAKPSQNLQKKPSWVAQFHSYRLTPHKMSPTIIKSVKHWYWREPRHLTIEECKVLQGFPEWFDIREKEYKFLGNSVCPPMARAIGRHLVTLLEEV